MTTLRVTVLSAFLSVKLAILPARANCGEGGDTWEYDWNDHDCRYECNEDADKRPWNGRHQQAEGRPVESARVVSERSGAVDLTECRTE